MCRKTKKATVRVLSPPVAFSVFLVAHSGGARYDSPYYYTNNAYVYEHSYASPGLEADTDSVAASLVKLVPSDAEDVVGHVLRLAYKNPKCKGVAALILLIAASLVIGH